MESVLNQLTNLFIGAIPTVVIFLLLWACYNLILHRPLLRVLAERRQKTSGAIEKAKADIALADAKAAEYEDRLRQAKAALFKSQEARRRQILDARAAAVAEVRSAAQRQVNDARAALAKDIAEARVRLQGQGDELAAEVIRMVFRPVGAAAGGQ